MKAATAPRARTAARLLRIDPCHGRFADGAATGLAGELRPGDVVVVNDAATLPASLPATLGEAALEVRLAQPAGDARWHAVLFGAGDWRTPTERRPPPPVVAPGEVLRVGASLAATVRAVSPLSPRLVELEFDRGGAALLAALYAHGRPVQYSHMQGDVALWDVQTAYAARPWAVEAPSAGLPLAAETLLALRRRGVTVATLTHAAGLSATGDPALDAALPLPERYELPATTLEAVRAAHTAGGRVVAVGTTVVRALEGAAAAGRLAPGPGETDLRIRPGFRPRVVDGLLTGLHEAGSSHLDLLTAFVARPLLDAAYGHAATSGYLGHEHGDVSLILCG